MLMPARLPVPSRPGVLFFQQSPLATNYDTTHDYMTGLTGEAMGCRHETKVVYISFKTASAAKTGSEFVVCTV